MESTGEGSLNMIEESVLTLGWKLVSDQSDVFPPSRVDELIVVNHLLRIHSFNSLKGFISAKRKA